MNVCTGRMFLLLKIKYTYQAFLCQAFLVTLVREESAWKELQCSSEAVAEAFLRKDYGTGKASCPVPKTMILIWSLFGLE